MHTLCDEGLKNLATWAFHLAQKAQESLAQENAWLSKSPLIHLLGLSFNVMCTAWRVENIKSQRPKKFWNNYLLQISQNKPKGNISIIRKSFPIYEYILIPGNDFLKVNFLTRLSSFSWSPFLTEKWFSIEWRIYLLLLHCFDIDCLRKGSSWGNFDFFTGVLFCKI